MTKPMFQRSLLNSLGVVAYVALVATFMNNAERFLGKTDTILTGIVFLLLLSISAAVVGSLVFGYPVILFLNGQKKEGVMMAISTIGCLMVELVLVLVVLLINRV